ncbi:hypothetical protein RND59_07435 [Vibrio ruber]|uniref:hypothetical protein n=1 Tax=Vibrio ruber TaxID=184755 RepID=UPI00289314D2|nr:hypothetical protein [Vibrio ruber]WNJ96887.1 hypothetical protein RND59_07435 [Vibrio ruber]
MHQTWLNEQMGIDWLTQHVKFKRVVHCTLQFQLPLTLISDTDGFGPEDSQQIHCAHPKRSSSDSRFQEADD